MAQLLIHFFVSVNICPQQFWMYSTAIPTVTAKHHGEQMYGLPCGLSPASLHVYCMSPSAEYGSVCHMFTCCSTMYDPGEGASHVICLCERSGPFQLASISRLLFLTVKYWIWIVLGNNAQSTERKNICAHIVCIWFSCPPPHSELIFCWFDVVLSGHGLVYFKWGFALQNTLVIPIIFDIAVNSDLRLL